MRDMRVAQVYNSCNLLPCSFGLHSVFLSVAADFCQKAKTVVPGAAVRSVVLSEQGHT